jgi:hypothetical protein
MTPEELRARIRAGASSRPPIFTYSNVISTLSLVIALSGLGATIYYNFLWHPEQLQVSYRVNHQKIDAAVVSLVFINNGRQAVAVDTIILMKAAAKAPLDACELTNTYVQKQFKERDEWESVATMSTGTWITTQYEDYDGTEVRYFDREYLIKRTRKVSLDNKESSSPSFLVDPQSAKVLNVEYDASFDGSKNEIFCLQVSFFDRLGTLHSEVVPGWSLTVRGEDVGDHQYVIGYGAEVRRYTLLPR